VVSREAKTADNEVYYVGSEKMKFFEIKEGLREEVLDYRWSNGPCMMDRPKVQPI
jgi:hypothetical protein